MRDVDRFEAFAWRDTLSETLTWPWARYFIPVVIGAEYAWRPHNEQQTRYWTHCYPSITPLPMMALVQHVRDADLSLLATPTLVFYSRDDDVVRPDAIEQAFAQFASEHKQLVAVSQSAHAVKHVLAEDILDPGNTASVAKTTSPVHRYNRISTLGKPQIPSRIPTCTVYAVVIILS